MADIDHLDIRTVQRYIQKGVMTQKEYEDYLKNLPDLAGDSSYVDYEQKFKQEEREVVEETPPAPVQPSEPAPAEPQAPTFGTPPTFGSDPYGSGT